MAEVCIEDLRFGNRTYYHGRVVNSWNDQAKFAGEKMNCLSCDQTNNYRCSDFTWEFYAGVKSKVNSKSVHPIKAHAVVSETHVIGMIENAENNDNNYAFFGLRDNNRVIKGLFVGCGKVMDNYNNSGVIVIKKTSTGVQILNDYEDKMLSATFLLQDGVEEKTEFE